MTLFLSKINYSLFITLAFDPEGSFLPSVKNNNSLKFCNPDEQLL